MREKEGNMNVGLQLKYLWHDLDVLELEVSASTGKFSGTAETYISIGGLAEAADALNGFPRDLSDVRELKFGEFGRVSAGGCASLHFFCKNSAGHAVVEVRIESEDESNTGSQWNLPEQNAHSFGEIEASAVDDFVAELRLLDVNKSGIASLRFANSPTP
jgi:hypothetical protein